MSQPAPSLGDSVREDFASYLRHLADRVERAARAVPEDKLWTNPYPYGNSIGVIVRHLTGNLNHYIGAGVAGTDYVRDRPAEFADPSVVAGPELLDRFRAAVAMVVSTLKDQTDDDLCRPIPPNPPVQTRIGLFLVVLAHLNNHIGQLSYLVRELGHSTDEPPVW